MPDAIEPKGLASQSQLGAARRDDPPLCFDILRPTSAPVSNRDIAMAFMTARGMDTDDARLVKLVAKRVGCCMRLHRDAGTVVSEDGPGQTMVWRVA